MHAFIFFKAEKNSVTYRTKIMIPHGIYAEIDISRQGKKGKKQGKKHF